MKNLLVISSSPAKDQSLSRQLLDYFAGQFQTKQQDMNITFRDLGQTIVPHLNMDTIGAFYTPEDQRNEAQQQSLKVSDELVAELQNADMIVIGSPMHNFSISSHLKTYFDQVARVGVTFQYTENGPQGLLNNKKVLVITSRGGNYSNPAYAAMDHQEPYIRTFLGFVGMNDVSFIHLQGVSSGNTEPLITQSKQEIEQFISALVNETEASEIKAVAV